MKSCEDCGVRHDCATYLGRLPRPVSAEACSAYRLLILCEGWDEAMLTAEAAQKEGKTG